MRIPFDIKYRPQIESGEYKMETRNGLPARIICWDRKGAFKQPLIVLIEGSGGEFIICATITGEYVGITGEHVGTDGHGFDLFIVTPEEELTEFEQQIENLLNLALPEGHAGTTIENTKRVASELLALAEKEIAKRHERDVYIPEDTYYEQLKKQREEGYNKGKVDALEKLPRWMKWNINKIFDDSRYVLTHTTDFNISSDMLLYDTVAKRAIFVSDLEKLPGF